MIVVSAHKVIMPGQAWYTSNDDYVRASWRHIYRYITRNNGTLDIHNILLINNGSPARVESLKDYFL